MGSELRFAVISTKGRENWEASATEVASGTMSRPLRLEFPGALFHVTSRGNRKQEIFRDDADHELFLKLLGAAVDRFGWIVTSYALMRNHFHIVMQLTRNTMSKGMQWLNGCYSQAFNRRHCCVGHLFQDRPHAPLVDGESYAMELLRYVVLNPVRAHIVEHPRDFKWSSYCALVGLVPAPEWLAVDDALAGFGPDRDLARAAFEQFVEAAIGVENNPWTNLIGQMYLGSDSWMKRVKEELKLRPRADDHPRSQRVIGEPCISEVIGIVARVFSADEHCIRERRGGVPRMAVAWVACNEAQMTYREIAAGLRLRSSGHVSDLIQRCDREVDRNPLLRDHLDTCIATLRRKNCEPKL